MTYYGKKLNRVHISISNISSTSDTGDVLMCASAAVTGDPITRLIKSEGVCGWTGRWDYWSEISLVGNSMSVFIQSLL